MQENKKNTLLSYQNSEGLIATSHIKTTADGNMYIGSDEVECIDEIKELGSFIRSSPNLWSIAKFNIQIKKYGKARSSAPIIGIPFDVALQSIIEGKTNIKSMYYLDDETSTKELEGRLIAYNQKKGDEIIFQLWQVLPYDLPTYYVHGIFDLHLRMFSHFDGALIFMDEKTKSRMQWEPFIPEKKFPYMKLFRLDGQIDTEEAKDMMHFYLPINELYEEYGIHLKIKKVIA